MMSDQSDEPIPRVVLVQCTGQKRDGKHPARELYDESDYYRKQRSYAEAVADRWFIQSAKYGFLQPDEEVESYDMHAKDHPDPDAWADEIAWMLREEVEPPATVVVLGGKDYADPLTPELERMGFEVLEPLRGQRIGERKRSLERMTNQKLEEVA